MPLAYPSNHLAFPTNTVGPTWAPQITQNDTISSQPISSSDPMYHVSTHSIGPDPMKLGHPPTLIDLSTVATHSNNHNQHRYAQSENKSLTGYYVNADI